MNKRIEMSHCVVFFGSAKQKQLGIERIQHCGRYEGRVIDLITS